MLRPLETSGPLRGLQAWPPPNLKGNSIHSQVKTAVSRFQSELSTISSSQGVGAVIGRKPWNGALSPKIGFLSPHAG